MRRFNFWIEQTWIDKLKKNRSKYGHSTVAGFLRYIVISFFESKK